MITSPCWAIQFVLPDSAYQGDTIVGKVLPPATVTVGGKPFTVISSGYFIIGVPRNQKTDLLVIARAGDKKRSKTIRIMAYPWKIAGAEPADHHVIGGRDIEALATHAAFVHVAV